MGTTPRRRTPMDSDHPDSTAPAPPRAPSVRPGRRPLLTDRQLWRLHRVAGIVTLPALVVLATSGVIELHGNTLDRWLRSDLFHVERGRTERTLDDQVAAAVARVERMPTTTPAGQGEAHGGAGGGAAGALGGAGAGRATVRRVVTAAGPESPTQVVFASAPDDLIVSVDPYRARVLGTRHAGDGLVAWATRVHATLDIDSPTIDLPTIAAVVDDGPATIPVPIAEIVLELVAGWSIVMVTSGVVLWWRHRRHDLGGSGGSGGSERAADPRVRRHVLPGAMAALATLFALGSGLLWTSYWGATWNRIVHADDATRHLAPSPLRDGREPDHDDENDHAGHAGSAGDARLTLNEVAGIAHRLGMRRGYEIELRGGLGPSAANQPIRLRTAWPSPSKDVRRVVLDSTDGTVLDDQRGDGDLALTTVTAAVQQAHVGVEFGAWSSAAATIAAVAIDWSALSGLALLVRRRPRARHRPTRTIGYGRRDTGRRDTGPDGADATADTDRHDPDARQRPTALARRGAIVSVVAVGLAFPLWGASAAAVALGRLALGQYALSRLALGRPTRHHGDG
jgi:uncharacterized iron-regulated membrane protein